MRKTFNVLVALIVSYGAYSQKVISKSDSGLKNTPAKLAKTDMADESGNTVHCKIKGKLVNGNSGYVKLVNERNDSFQGGIEIPIVNGYFEYDLKIPFVEKYTLILEEDLKNGAFRPVNFYAENAEVDFVLHPSKEFDQISVSGGKLTDKMVDYAKDQKKIFEPMGETFSKELDLLWNSNNYFTEEVMALTDKCMTLQGEERNKVYRKKDELLESGKGYTPRAWFLINKMDSIQKIKYKWEADYIKSNQDIFSYWLLMNEVKWYKQNKKNIDLTTMSNLATVYKKLFPFHPYTKQIGDIMEGIKTAKVGGMFIDFSAPTIDGEIIRASDLVAGKVALIDLWSSWCGSCRSASISFIPVYKKYKDKGFVILGVANEFKNTYAYKKAIEKDKYPWLNLIELDSKNRIWDQYNITNSGGSTFLVDSKGIIVAVNPDSKELDKLLEGLLN